MMKVMAVRPTKVKTTVNRVFAGLASAAIKVENFESNGCGDALSPVPDTVVKLPSTIVYKRDEGRVVTS